MLQLFVAQGLAHGSGRRRRGALQRQQFAQHVEHVLAQFHLRAADAGRHAAGDGGGRAAQAAGVAGAGHAISVQVRQDAFAGQVLIDRFVQRGQVAHHHVVERIEQQQAVAHRQLPVAQGLQEAARQGLRAQRQILALHRRQAGQGAEAEAQFEQRRRMACLAAHAGLFQRGALVVLAVVQQRQRERRGFFRLDADALEALGHFGEEALFEHVAMALQPLAHAHVDLLVQMVARLLGLAEQLVLGVQQAGAQGCFQPAVAERVGFLDEAARAQAPGPVAVGLRAVAGRERLTSTLFDIHGSSAVFPCGRAQSRPAAAGLPSAEGAGRPP